MFSDASSDCELIKKLDRACADILIMPFKENPANKGVRRAPVDSSSIFTTSPATSWTVISAFLFNALSIWIAREREKSCMLDPIFRVFNYLRRTRNGFLLSISVNKFFFNT
jgi:hypothetical protein